MFLCKGKLGKQEIDRLQNNWKNLVMNTTLPFKSLYQPDDRRRELFWRRFEEIGGFKELARGYLGNRLDLLLSQKMTAPVHVKKNEGVVKERSLVFIDGFFAQELSSFPEAVVLPIKDAYQTYSSFIESRIQRTVAREKSPLAVLNGALAVGAVFVYVPAHTVIEGTVEIIQLYSNRETFTLASPRIQMVVGKQSQLKLIMRQSTDTLLCCNQAVDIQLEEGARVEFLNIFPGCEEGFLFDTLRATLKAHSSLEGYILSKGAKACIRDYHVELLGEGAEARVKAALYLPLKRQEQVDILMEHKAARCISDQHIKQVGHESSRHSFSGTIYVHKAAKETMSYQKHGALLLHPTAFSATQPKLEIFTDEVKASHGATVGQLHKESLFYLISRGIPKEIARALLIEAHLREITDSIILSEVNAWKDVSDLM
jgi:Fe-S cluster assembly protein SufD